MVKKLESYKDEKHRNRRKSQRRREELRKAALAASWNSWSDYETAVINQLITIAQKE